MKQEFGSMGFHCVATKCDINRKQLTYKTLSCFHGWLGKQNFSPWIYRLQMY